MLSQRIPLSSLSSMEGFLTVSINFDYGPKHCPSVELPTMLSPAELRVIKNISMPAKSIAEELNLSVHTVKKHIAKMLDKTNCKSTTELALWAERKHILNN